MLSDRRNTRTAHRFLGKALKTMRNWPPVSITVDKLGSYPRAIRRLQRDGRLSEEIMHRTSKYLNNIIEADHGALKQLIRPARGFQTMKTAYATIKGFEIMHMIRRGHCILREPGAAGKVRFVNKLFGLASTCSAACGSASGTDLRRRPSAPPFARQPDTPSGS